MTELLARPTSRSSWNSRGLAFGLLVIFVFTLPWDGGLSLFSAGGISRILGLVTLPVGLAAIVSKGELSFRPPSLFHLFAVLFVLWGVCSFFWSVQPTVALVRAATYVQLLALVWLIWEFGRSEQQRAILMQAYVIGCYVAAIIALHAYFTSWEMRNVGNFNANGLSFYLALGIPLAWRSMFAFRSKALFTINLIYLPTVFLVVVIAASRGGLLTALVAVSIVPLTYGGLSQGRKLVLIASFILAAWGVYSYVPTTFPQLQANFERLGETREELESGTLTYRRMIWGAGLELFEEHPVNGVGLGAFRIAVAEYYGARVSSHNSFLSVLVDLGVVGLALFALTLLGALAGSLVLNWPARAFALVLFATLLLGMFPLEVEDRKPVWFILALLAGQQAITITGKLESWKDSGKVGDRGTRGSEVDYR